MIRSKSLKIVSMVSVIFYGALFFIAGVESRWLLDRICDYDLTDPHGLITSANYPHSYPSSMVCTYKVFQPHGRIISLSLSHIDLGWNDTTDSCSGRLEIYDGEDEIAHRLETFCGTDYFIPSRVINSTANALFLKFESFSSSQENTGFQAIYKTTDRQCGGLFKGNNGTIKHPTYGTEYGNNEQCNWVIQAPPRHIIKLSFTRFTLEISHDYVRVSELYEDRITDLGKFNGTTLPPTVTTRGRVLYLYFRSDVSRVHSGFRAHYTFIDTFELF